MKTSLVIVFILACLSGGAQKITKYYDENWGLTDVSKATYYADYVRRGDVYDCTSYWLKTMDIKAKSVFPDTTMAKPQGTQVRFYKKGNVEDSLYYFNDKLQYAYHYYPNGQLAAKSYLKNGSDEMTSEGYDEDGKKIKNYTFMREAEFKGGQKAWVNYIIKNVDKNLDIKSESDVTVQVQVQFIVDEEGIVSSANVLQSSGYTKIDQDAVRVVKSSPTWKSALLYNEAVKAYRVQPLTYQIPASAKVSEKKS